MKYFVISDLDISHRLLRVEEDVHEHAETHVYDHQVIVHRVHRLHVYDIVYIDSDNLARGQCKWCLQGVQRIDNNGKKLPARPSVRWQQSEGVQAGDP